MHVLFFQLYHVTQRGLVLTLTAVGAAFSAVSALAAARPQTCACFWSELTQEQLSMELQALVEQEQAATHPALPEHFLVDLVRRPGSNSCDLPPNIAPTMSSCSVVLERPYAAHLAAQLRRCLLTMEFPRPPKIRNHQLAVLELVDCKATSEEIWLNAIRKSSSTVGLASDSCGFRSFLRQILVGLGPRGVLSLLGQRWTAGSCNVLPPSWEEMYAAFQQPHRLNIPGCTLTVGGRAIAKHSHRGEEGFWARTAAQTAGGGKSDIQIRGGDTSKNAAASRVLVKLLESAAWANTHALPGGVLVHEIRNADGYGARWAWNSHNKDSLSFRGFLEPQMAGGHEARWRH